jgi:FixJ family two-component response regulator
MTGLELQHELTRRQLALPLVFASSSADLPTAVDAMKAGAFDFMLKSISFPDLRARIQAALARSHDQLRAEEMRQLFAQRLVKVTDREHEVMALALSGTVNKQIAKRLGMSLRTVEGHRSRILLKTGVDSLLEFLHLAREADFDIDRHFPTVHGS